MAFYGKAGSGIQRLRWVGNDRAEARRQTKHLVHQQVQLGMRAGQIRKGYLLYLFDIQVLKRDTSRAPQEYEMGWP